MSELTSGMEMYNKTFERGLQTSAASSQHSHSSHVQVHPLGARKHSTFFLEKKWKNTTLRSCASHDKWSSMSLSACLHVS